MLVTLLLLLFLLLLWHILLLLLHFIDAIVSYAQKCCIKH